MEAALAAAGGTSAAAAAAAAAPDVTAIPTMLAALGRAVSALGLLGECPEPLLGELQRKHWDWQATSVYAASGRDRCVRTRSLRQPRSWGQAEALLQRGAPAAFFGGVGHGGQGLALRSRLPDNAGCEA